MAFYVLEMPMKSLSALILSIGLGISAANVMADEKAMKEHEEMGKKGVTPEMMKNEDKELSANEREEAKKRHMAEGTKGMTPHATKKKKHAAMPNKEEMKKHEEMGKKGVYPEGKPETK
jgi:hypothetical protein